MRVYQVYLSNGQTVEVKAETYEVTENLLMFMNFGKAAGLFNINNIQGFIRKD